MAYFFKNCRQIRAVWEWITYNRLKTIDTIKGLLRQFTVALIKQLAYLIICTAIPTQSAIICSLQCECQFHCRFPAVFFQKFDTLVFLMYTIMEFSINVIVWFWCECRRGDEGGGVHVRSAIGCGGVRRDAGMQPRQPHRLWLRQVQDRRLAVHF